MIGVRRCSRQPFRVSAGDYIFISKATDKQGSLTFIKETPNTVCIRMHLVSLKSEQWSEPGVKPGVSPAY